MVSFKLVLSAAFAAQAALATPIRARTPYAVKETHHLPRQWKRVARASGAEVVHLQIGIKQGDFAELERHLYEGKYNSPAQLGQMLDTERATRAHLAKQSLTPSTLVTASISMPRRSMTSSGPRRLRWTRSMSGFAKLALRQKD